MNCMYSILYIIGEIKIVEVDFKMLTIDWFFLIWNDVKFVLLKNLLFDELISLLIGNFFLNTKL